MARELFKNSYYPSCAKTFLAMQKQISSYVAALKVALLLPMGACTKVENIPSPTPLVIKEEVKISYTPKYEKELSELRDKILVPLIQKKKYLLTKQGHL